MGRAVPHAGLQEQWDAGPGLRQRRRPSGRPGLDASTNREDDAEIDPFRQRGLPGIELEDTYANVIQHTPADTVDRVNTGSLQLMGDQTLGVARAIDKNDLNHAAA